MNLSLAAFLPRSQVNGPGCRSVVWVQGCPFRCEGCFNPDFQTFTGGTPTPVDELADRILSDPETQGVTFSGGEPFVHAAPLAELAERVKSGGKGVMIFTGYSRKALEASKCKDQQRLLDAADLLVAGLYRQDLAQNHPLLSSRNQELVFLTERYRGVDSGPARRQAEIHINSDGTVAVTGFVVV